MAKKEENKSSLGCLGTAFLVIIFVVIFGGCSACMHGGSNDDSEPKTHKVAKKKKKPTKKQIEAKKKKKRELQDSQRSMSDDLEANSTLNKYVSKIVYNGDGEAEIKTTVEFTALSNSEKTLVASKVNNLVTSDAEDTPTVEDDPYSFLNFTYEGNELGHSKYFSHNEYKWK